MCKSSVLGFVLIFAFLFHLEKPSWKLAAIISTMTAGVIMMVAGETAFNVLGFILVMSAAASSGFRWSLTQILLLRNPATSNPFSSIFFLAPVMFLTLLVIAVPVEGFSELSAAFSNMAAEKGVLLSLGILLFPGCLAFAMTASEFALLQRTSVVTLSICGIFKEVLTISTASIVFQDELTPINASGLLVTIATMAYYNYTKIQKMREEARLEAHLAVEREYAPVLAHDPDVDGSFPNGDAGRRITSDLIRSSLGVMVNEPRARQVTDSPSRVSPVKRPEDLD
jgi:solute carrier family 35, member C2